LIDYQELSSVIDDLANLEGKNKESKNKKKDDLN
jgi:hypothetical protein